MDRVQGVVGADALCLAVRHRPRLIEAWRRENRARRNPEREIPWPERSSLQLLQGLFHSGAGPGSMLVQAEQQQHAAEVLKLLKDKDREILWMRHYDDLSFPEAAAVLGVTAGAARVRYVRALDRLREVWQQLHPE